MCSPGKPPPAAKKGTQAKFARPVSKTPCRTPKSQRQPQSLSKARGGIPSKVKDLTVEETLAVAEFLKNLPEGHPDRDGRPRIKGLPRIWLKNWKYDPTAPFFLSVRTTGKHYIPSGEKADACLLNLMVKEVQKHNLNVTDPDLIVKIFDGLDQYAIQGALERAENTFKNASLFQYLENFAQKDDVQAVLNQIHERFLRAEDATKAVDAKVDAAAAKALLELRPTSINAKLRINPLDPWARSRANDIDKYLETLPIHVGECYRGINAKEMPSDIVLAWNRRESEYTDNAFTTASLSADIAWKYAGTDPRYRVVLVIQSKTGRIVPPNVGSDTEQEIAFKHGAKFLIKQAHTYNLFQENQHMIVHVEEIEDCDDEL